jgi:hypothetical protein
MPWYQYIDDELDVCDPESYKIIDRAPDTENGTFLNAIFADEIPNDPQRRPDIDGTPGLLYYLVRAYKTSKGQPYSEFPPVPLEVRMSNTKARSKSLEKGLAENPEKSKPN